MCRPSVISTTGADFKPGSSSDITMQVVRKEWQREECARCVTAAGALSALTCRNYDAPRVLIVNTSTEKTQKLDRQHCDREITSGTIKKMKATLTTHLAGSIVNCDRDEEPV